MLVVPDTNVYLHSPEPFHLIDWPALLPADPDGVHLVIPLLVVDELDRAKQADPRRTVTHDSKEPVRTRARTTLRTVEELFDDPARITTVRPGQPPVRAEVLFDPPGHARLQDPDAELVDRAVALRDLYGAPVTVVTGMLLRARAAGLVCLALRPDDGPAAQQATA